MADVAASALSWIDAKKRQVMAELATAMAAPETVGPNIWQAVKDLSTLIGRQEDTGDPVQNSRNLMGGFGPGNLGGALVGMLRPKGDPSLMLSHGLSSLEAPHGGTLKELMHPSLAVTSEKRGLNNPFGESRYNSLLIPRMGAFDPAYSTSTLFNRDAYIARKSDYPGGTYATPKQRIETRGMEAPPRTEGSTGWWQDPEHSTYNTKSSHDVAIMSSPVFRSFAEYEKSGKGAKNLGAYFGDVGYWSDNWRREFANWWNPKNRFTDDWLAELRAAAPTDKTAAYLLKSAQQAPSEYAELKVSGPVPIHGGLFAGALLSKGMAHHAETLAARGIPSVTKDMTIDNKRAFEIADAMQRMAGPVKERSLRVRAGWEPGQDAPPRQIYMEPTGATNSTPVGSRPKATPVAALASHDIHKDASALATAKLMWKDLKTTGKEFTHFQNANGDNFAIDLDGNVMLLAFGKNIPFGNIKLGPIQ